MNTVNTKTHSLKEMTEFSVENADIKSLCYCKQRTKSTLSLSSECVETKLCRPCTSFTSHPHSWCGMVWYRTLRVNVRICVCCVWCMMSVNARQVSLTHSIPNCSQCLNVRRLYLSKQNNQTKRCTFEIWFAHKEIVN